jgi:protein-L-isoaspartate O-methyltransferase
MDELPQTRMRRALVVGAHATGEFVDNYVGTLIVMEQDPDLADEARTRLSHLGDKAVIISGDPRRMLYKLAGPFDTIVYDMRYDSIRPALEHLLVPGGIMTRFASP